MRGEFFFVILALCSLVASQNQTISCTFTLSTDHYTCGLPNLDLDEKQEIIFDVSGHLEGFGDENVTKVEYYGGNISFIFPELFTTFTSLRHFQSSFSGLERIPYNGFANANNLERILIYKNPLRVLEAKCFSGIRTLININLNSNEIETIDANAFAGLDNLVWLSLSDNKISKLDSTVFQPLSFLMTLELSANLIERIDGQTFLNNPLLNVISFYGNQITSVGPKIFDGFKDFFYLDMRDNLCDDNLWIVYDTTTVDTIRKGLTKCFENYVENVDDVKRFVLELRGSLILRDENGNEVLRL